MCMRYDTSLICALLSYWPIWGKLSQKSSIHFLAWRFYNIILSMSEVRLVFSQSMKANWEETVNSAIYSAMGPKILVKYYHVQNIIGNLFFKS